jgi:hypothetical protein
MKTIRSALLPEQRAAIRRALLDILTACCILSSVALFTAGAISGDKAWIIVACGMAGIAVWLTEGDSTL